MNRLDGFLNQRRTTVYLIAGAVLFSLPAALYAAASNGVEAACWALLSLFVLTYILIMRVK